MNWKLNNAYYKYIFSNYLTKQQTRNNERQGPKSMLGDDTNKTFYSFYALLLL